jgi:hypothetical protein
MNSDSVPSLLRVYWPLRLAIDSSEPKKLLVKLGYSAGGVQEVVVVGPAATPPGRQEAVAWAWRQQHAPPSRLAGDTQLHFIVHPARGVPGGLVPIPLPTVAAAAARPRTRLAARQVAAGRQCAQVILCEPPPAQRPYSCSKLRVRVLSHTLAFLLAAALVWRRGALCAAACGAAARLDRWVCSQLVWFMTAQPAGEPAAACCD